VPTKQQAEDEWRRFFSRQPRFARSVVAQEAILAQAALRSANIRKQMCYMVRTSTVAFPNLWKAICDESKPIRGRSILDPVLECLSSNRDPKDCLPSIDPEGWYNGPLNPVLKIPRGPLPGPKARRAVRP